MMNGSCRQGTITGVSPRDQSHQKPHNEELSSLAAKSSSVSIPGATPIVSEQYANCSHASRKALSRSCGGRDTYMATVSLPMNMISAPYCSFQCFIIQPFAGEEGHPLQPP